MINRNNYEAYFLLLADNELSAEDTATVKQFAAQHPDLAEELELLLSCRLEMGSLPIFPKEKLLRPVMWDAEKTEPVQTQMLLLLDGELNPAQQQQLQHHIAANAALQAEWNTLQQAKLPVEAVAHPDKETLRHSAKKVRPLLWMRWVAAAAVVAGLGWFWLQQELQTGLPVNNTLAGNIEQEQKIITNSKIQPATVENKVVPEPALTVAASTPVAQPAAPKQSGIPSQAAVIRSTINEDGPAPANIFPANTPANPEPVIAQQERNANLNLSINADAPVPAMQLAHLEPATTQLPVLTSSHIEESFTEEKVAIQAAEESDYVTIGAAHVNKQKMRGLFRNVTRTVARGFSKSKMEPDVYATR